MTGAPTIGIVTLAGADWIGGVNYVTSLFTALASLPAETRPRAVLVVQSAHVDCLDLYQAAIGLAHKVLVVQPGAAGQASGNPRVQIIGSLAESLDQVDFLYPINSDVLPGTPSGSWIPDFQHRYLPHLFSAKEIADRDRRFEKIARQARMVVFSSGAARSDFSMFYPWSKTQTRVLQFCSVADAAAFDTDPDALRQTYGLPQEYLICCNQFWAHKDHATLFRALSVLTARGRTLHVACTGNTTDYRNPDYYDQLMKEARELGVGDQIHMLGVIDRRDQVGLIRGARCVVQPSLFEGWSTVVEDTRELGAPIVLSDFPVHIEQNPPLGVYFRRQDPQDLARAVEACLERFRMSERQSLEEQAKAGAAERFMRFGLTVAAIARDGAALTGEAPSVAEPTRTSRQKAGPEPGASRSRPPEHTRGATVIFFHIPKAAGSTVNRYMDGLYAPEDIYTVDGSNVLSSIEAFENLPEGERARFKLVRGHMYFGIHAHIPGNSAYVTMLRNPCDRIVSHYHYVLRNPDHYLHRIVSGQGMDLEAYARSGVSNELDNGQTRLLAGPEGQDCPIGQVSERLFRLAATNLEQHFAAVGIQERFDQSLRLFATVLGWEPSAPAGLESVNVGRDRPRLKDIPKSALEAIRSRNAYDLKLYALARELFGRQLAAHGVD